ncbi:leucyl aminopeptidase [Butyrivibrio sp. CB08]|uniref:aminopeptidase n=1 Tax=Butyrivibrio sp. CB08 TaxID=2364879 RepID=UPI000EAA3C6B|nr:aminopeptidase [Butyrivibrio sp. CB08]RKM61220.1 leucyl aminopeptidase [Butyrivibrio sp. CB08]
MNSEELIFEFENGEDVIQERLDLAAERIGELPSESLSNEKFDDYFKRTAGFVSMVLDTYKWVLEGGPDKDDLASLQKRNRQLFEDILPENYAVSYGNPDYAVENLSKDYGQLLSSLYFELRSMIGYAFEKKKEELVIRIELFLEVYGVFKATDESGALPKFEDLKKIMYWFYSDYAETERIARFASIVDPSESFFRDIITGSDLSDVRYLYKFGEYITDNEIKTAEHLASLSQEDIDRMATTFTEGYRIGFEMTGKDITIKKTASIIYNLGFERIIKKAIENLKAIDLDSTIYRSIQSTFYMGGNATRSACTGAVPNKQFDYDHKDDEGLFLDSQLVNRRLEAVRAAGEKYKAKAKLFGGPAVIEVFGENPFSPQPKANAVQLSASQRKMMGEYKVQASLITNEYIIGKERSFTIISFPIPEIGENFKTIFDEVVRINTLDYKLYQTIQQRIVDALDEAEYVEVKGMGDNHTDIKVCMHELKDKSKETNFENCVADVNIPVGEVFTSPKLTGTEGVLHVTGVYLEGLFFKNLEINFKDGCTTTYTCTNFESEEENKKYIEDNILFNHKMLPIGEFAIGTNTLAYVIARKYGIEERLPILIAEKTGPHFAVGDTCYSYEEDNVTYNPDGKAIVARENEISCKRTTNPSEAYFSCHTDITIPYDELGSIRAVRADGSSVTIIEKGRFVLPGTEELNKPLDGEF